ncbi:TPA: SH3 domain-containing protein [Clostridioides difficile]|nr:SH3 domain-containing protein [Clostridioides difficile]
MISELMLKNFRKSSINFKTKIKLNLREKPDINSLKLKSIPEGKIVKLKCVDGIWAEVESNYDKGWLLYKYLERLSNTKNNSNDTIKNRKKNYIGNIRTNGLSLELRNDRTLESKVITTIPDGFKVEVCYSVGKWARVNINKNEKRYSGYVYNQYIEEHLSL